MKSLRSLVVALLAVAMQAQTTSSTLTGSVTDSSGAVIAGAHVSLVNEENGVALPSETNHAGLYRIVGLSPGMYRVDVEAPGFQKISRTGVNITISQTLQLDLQLKVGNMQESVSVEASAPLLESQTSTIGQLVSSQMVQGMPMPNRSSTALLTLIPGAAIQNVASDIPIFSVGGGRTRNQQFTLDGGNHSNTVGLAVNQSQVPLPMDAMQEFRVLINNFSAEYGQSQSGVVTMATRSGTNQWHGSAFEYLRNEALDARSFFAATRPKFRQNQYGGSFGGPIRRDKTHFFVTYERTGQITGGVSVQTVPTLAQRLGDFSQTRNAAGQLVTIYDPATTDGRTRQPFAGNIIPASRIDPVAKAIAAYWPEPNLPGTATGANNYSQNTRPFLNRDIVVGRLDHQLNISNQLMFRYFIADSRQGNDGIYPEAIRGADSIVSTTNQRTQNILGTWIHTFRPNLINEFRGGEVRRDYHLLRPGAPGAAARIGLKGVSDAGFPIISVTGFQGLGGAPYRYSSPLLDFQLQDTISWFKGKHAIKMGMEWRPGIFNDDTDTSSSGSFSFGPNLTGIPGQSGSGLAFATFLLGEVDSANIIKSDPIRSHAAYWAAFIQDDWRITPKLTLNLGLRWEGTQPRVTDDNRMNAFDTTAINPVSNTPGVITFAGRNGVPRSAYDFDANNFGPRFGFAFQALSHTIIRGGAGVIYGASVNSIVGTAATLGFSTDVRIAATESGITSAMRLRDGFPAYTRPTVDQFGPGYGAVPVGVSPTTAVTFFERSRPTPISYQMNLNIQHQLGQNTIMEVGYTNNLSHHLPAPDLSINQVPPSQLGPGNAQVKRPFPQFTNVSVLNPPLGNSAYHAGMVKVERRFSKGLTLLAHYTYSKFLDDVESFTEIGDVGSYMDFYNRRLDRGPSGSDIRHRAVISGVYDLPLLRNHGLVTSLFGGWKTGIIASFQSGSPFTVFSSGNQTNAFTPGTLRADLIGNPVLDSSQRSLARWFNTAAFAAPGPFKFGTAGRGILFGPGMQNIDSSFIKSFAIRRERLRAELRADLFNLLNHARFGLPGHTVGVANFGIINSAGAGRSAQLAVRLEF